MMKMANKKIRTHATTSGVTDGMRPRIANCENDNDDNVDNDDNENDFLTVYRAANDCLSDLTTFQSEKTSFILTPKTYLSLGTLKVRTLAKPGKSELVLSEMNRYRWDIVGLSETNLPSTGIERIKDITLITSGRSDGVHRRGVGFLLSKRAKQSLLAFHPVSERIITIRLKGSITNMTIVKVYATDSSWSDQEAKECKVTWRSPDGHTANMIDYILVDKRWKSSVLNTVSIAGGDFDSDLDQVMSELRLRIRKPQ
ncbi:hypothetical protein QYM36_011501 [Artemia franciscana]|uniref:Uncharacterized protein n=1 Tax=Artemia franciscana TaxID=6661 RepID=A0AA88HSI5_ARTSF|nr:hypothetical protein QYM36_011501 [Artemia franciscana]